MKKILLSALFLGATFSANAQLMGISRGIHIVPGTFTKSGKDIVTSSSSDGSHINIFNSNLNIVKQIIPPDLGLCHKDYQERAIVKPIGANVINESVSLPNDEAIAALSNAEMIQKLKDITGLETGWEIFTDYKGRTCCFYSYDNCFAQKTFNKAYPYSSYTIIEGYIYEIHCEYELVYPENYEESAEWTIVEDSERRWMYANYEDEVYVYDFDNNMLYDRRIISTQTLFNDDEKWEYIVPLYSELEKVYSNRSEWHKGDSIILTRSVDESYDRKGYAIYNEDGNKIFEIVLDDTYTNVNIGYIYKLDGKLLLETYVSTDVDSYIFVFIYDPSSSEIRQISSSKSERFFDVEGRTINFNAEGNADAALFGMNGMKVASAKSANGKKLSIDAGNIPAGVYNVTLTKNGRVEKSQKVVLK